MTESKAGNRIRRELPDGVYEEHSIVVLNRPLSTGDGVLPAGTRGVVHDSKPDGSSYIVEFDHPFFCVIEVSGGNLYPG